METAKSLLHKLELGVLTVMGVGATLIMFFNAVLRYAFDSSLMWSEEAIRILFVASMFLAITMSFARDEHVGFDALVKSTRLGRLVRNLGCAISLIVVGSITAYYGYTYNAFVGGTPLPGTDLPTGVFLVPGVVAGVVWALIGIVRLVLCPFDRAKSTSDAPAAASGD
jgi:TRAP-type C4-dicarboxylate transport system permease small subunit